MSEQIFLDTRASRQSIYEALIPQVEALLKNEPDGIARMANFCAVLHEIPGFFWVGFYFVKEGFLVLGPFQGPVACSRFSISQGVCGAAVRGKKTQNVPDVNLFPGHIACSAHTQSEMVIPLMNSGGEVWAVLDIDSKRPNDFSSVDEKYLGIMLSLIHPE